MGLRTGRLFLFRVVREVREVAKAKANTPALRKKAMLTTFAECGNVTQACKIANIGRTTHYEWMRDDPDYVKAFNDALEQAADRLEQEARRRAVEGTSKPVFYKGEECGYIQEYSDTLLIFLLKGARPEKYRDNIKQEITGNLEVGIKLPSDIPDD